MIESTLSMTTGQVAGLQRMKGSRDKASKAEELASEGGAT